MVDNQHRQIPGYRDLDQDTVDLIRDIKEAEQKLVAFWSQVRDRCHDLNTRDYAMARTHLEDGFIRLVRSVAKPNDPWNAEVIQQAAEGRY